MIIRIRRSMCFLLLAAALAPRLLAAEPAVEVAVDGRRAVAANDPFWANAVFHPTEYLSTEWGTEHLKLLRDSGLTLKYVRIYNQPEDASFMKEDGTVAYRWDHFDRRADMILSQGLRPLVAFYSMPPQIAADIHINRKRPFLDGKKIYTGPPRDYSAWQAMCADFTRHVIARYGEDEVARWRFTCWNEPDLAGFWHKGDVVEYRKLYDHFAAGVKSVCSRVPIGGPAFSSANIYKKPELFRAFLEHITSGTNHATGKPGSAIDYLAMHTYGGHGGGGSSACPYPSVDYLLEQQLRIVKIRDEFPQLRKVPIIFQEWGVSSGGTKGMDKQPLAEVRNTHYAAAFLTTMAARHIELRLTAKPRIADLFICLSGYEVRRTRDFQGFRTAQTLHGFDKPLLNGYRVLNHLGSELVASHVKPAGGHLSAIASREGENRLVVVVTNFENDRPDSAGPAQPVKLKVATPWPDGTQAELRHWRVDRDHSNAYTVYCRFGRPVAPSPKQIEQIRQRMELEALHAPRRIAAGGTVELDFELPCNGISLVELIRRN